MLCKAFSLLAERVSSQSQSERVELADEDQKAWPKIAQALSPAELVDVHVSLIEPRFDCYVGIRR